MVPITEYQIPEKSFSIPSYENNVTLIMNFKKDVTDKRQKVCLELCIALLYYYNNEQAKGICQLKETANWINMEKSIVPFFIEKVFLFFVYCICCYYAWILDIILYVFKVAINPFCWISSKKKKACQETCNFLNRVEQKYHRKKQEKNSCRELYKQIKSCLKIYNQIIKTTKS